MGRLRLRAARLDLHPHPRALLPGHDARPRSARRSSACCSPTRVPSVVLGSAAPWHVVDGAGTHARASGRAAHRARIAAARRARSSSRRSPSSRARAPVEVGGLPYHGKLVLTSDGKAVPAGQRRRARVLSPRRRRPRRCRRRGRRPRSRRRRSRRAPTRSRRSGRVPATSSFDLYADWRSQVYGGINAETPAVTQAVTGDEEPRRPLSRARSRRRTSRRARAARRCPRPRRSGTPVPYLVSVAGSRTTRSRPTTTGAPSCSALPTPRRRSGSTAGSTTSSRTLDPTGRVASATIVSNGSTVTLTGMQVRDDLGLRSSWFDIGFLSLAPVRAPVTPRHAGRRSAASSAA